MVDLLCIDDVDEFGRELDDPMEELFQDVIHMTLESYGTNPDAPTRSLGADDMLSGEGPTTEWLARCKTKLEEDPRIQAAALDWDEDANEVSMRLQADEGGLGVRLEFDDAGNFLRWSRA